MTNPSGYGAGMLHRALGLTDDEAEQIAGILGRPPNPLELAMYAVMWSEHCSYKSSRLHLKRLPTEAPWVIVGPGENAGVVDVGDGIAAAIRIESHNHPSAIEPYQGAATGVGGILRDIFTMGARPIALMDPLRFGPARRRPQPLDRGGRRQRHLGIRQRGRRAHGRRRGGVRRHVSGQPPRQRALPRCASTRATRARSGERRRQPRGASRLVDRTRRHRWRERPRIGGLLRGRRRRGKASVGAGRRSVRGEAPHRGVPRAARRRPRRRHPRPRGRGPHVRDLRDCVARRGRHGRRRPRRAVPRDGHGTARDHDE